MGQSLSGNTHYPNSASSITAVQCSSSLDLSKYYVNKSIPTVDLYNDFNKLKTLYNQKIDNVFLINDDLVFKTSYGLTFAGGSRTKDTGCTLYNIFQILILFKEQKYFTIPAVLDLECIKTYDADTTFIKDVINSVVEILAKHSNVFPEPLKGFDYHLEYIPYTATNNELINKPALIIIPIKQNSYINTDAQKNYYANDMEVPINTVYVGSIQNENGLKVPIKTANCV